MGIFDDISWKCDAFSKGVDYANMADRVRKCENRYMEYSTVTITLAPVVPDRHYPIRSKRRH